MPRRQRILVTCPPGIPPFAALDAKLLSKEFDTDILPISGFRSIASFKSAAKHADAILVWFLGRHALPAVSIARAAGIPIVSVIGGFEVAWVSELGYGIRPGSTKNRILRWMVMSSDRVISVSQFSRNEALTRFPRLADKFHFIPNAVDTALFALPIQSVRGGVASAGAITQETIGRKSWHLFLEAARRLPNIPFFIAGGATDAAGKKLMAQLPSNVSWLGALDQRQLVNRFQLASVYTQLSVYESFGVALAEAMSCGCFPVVSDRGALPEVVSSEGHVVTDLTPTSVESAIRAALQRPDSDRANVRSQIVANFGVERRQRLLSDVFLNILSKHTS